MTAAISSGASTPDPPIQQQQLSFEEFLANYGGDDRYELIDGEVFDLEPTGKHVREAPSKKLPRAEIGGQARNPSAVPVV